MTDLRAATIEAVDALNQSRAIPWQHYNKHLQKFVTPPEPTTKLDVSHWAKALRG